MLLQTSYKIFRPEINANNFAMSCKILNGGLSFNEDVKGYFVVSSKN